MLILKILAGLAVMYILYMIAIEINKYTQKRYRYLFLDKVTLATSLSGYGALFVGYGWYMNALKNHGDILNGQILIGVGLALLIWTIYSNIKNTDLLIGSLFTVIQQIIYIAVGIGGAVILFFLFAAFAQAKPVYRIN